MTILLVGLAAAGVSLALTGVVRKYALQNDILDHPNHRSMHVRPVPRGGGVAIVAVVVGGTTLLSLTTDADLRLSAALVGGGTLVAVIGWVDDRRNVAVGHRLLGHIAAACWAVFWLGGLPTLDVGGSVVRLGTAGSVLAALLVIWWINLYNFMDGIDGIAGGQALSVALAGCLLLSIGAGGAASFVMAIVAGAAAGFLYWNWSPARIFMGDAGSGFLGYLFAVFALAGERSGAVPLLVWMILSGVFLVDATFTLLRRAARGERVAEAHRTHAYQRVVAAGYSHARVTCGVMGINVVLAGIAVTALTRRDSTALMFALAVLLLSVTYLLIELRAPMTRPVGRSSTGAT